MSDGRLIKLKTGGRDYSGWQEINVTTSMDSIAGAFSVKVADKAKFASSAWPIKMGDTCELTYDDSIIVTGHIEDFNIEYSASDHSVTVAGRDKTADLVDCSYVQQAKSWKKQTISQLLDKVLVGFDITIVKDSSVTKLLNTKLDLFCVTEGESVFNAVLKLCHLGGMLPLTYGDGKLYITRSGTTNASDNIATRFNIKEGSLRQSNKDRFSAYYVKGQDKASDDKTSADYLRPSGSAEDAVITRTRPLALIMEGKCDNGICGARAKWEAAVRAGASRAYDYTVQGWAQSNGVLWKINQLVFVEDEVFGVSEKLLINAVKYNMSPNAGMTATLSLCAQGKYDASTELNKIVTPFDKEAETSVFNF